MVHNDVSLCESFLSNCGGNSADPIQSGGLCSPEDGKEVTWLLRMRIWILSIQMLLCFHCKSTT